jgi:nitrate/nitrite-specific signal transduction histidine kinase
MGRVVGRFFVRQSSTATQMLASPVEIDLRLAGGSVELTVCDDGRGFYPETVPAGHLGLSIMHERAAVGARVGVESRPGGGTRVLVGWREPSPAQA